MSVRVVRWLAWACVPLSVLSLWLSVLFHYLTAQRLERLTGSSDDIVLLLLVSLLLTAYPAVGALIVARHPRHAIGWLLCAIGLGLGLSWLGVGYGDYARRAHPDTPDGPLALWLAIWLFQVTIAGAGTFLLLLFPSGHLPSRHWRPVARAAGLGLGLMSVNAAFMPGPLAGSRDNPANPFGIAPAAGLLRWVGVVAVVVLLAVFALGVLSVIVRFRRARGVERAQLKWFALAVALLFAWNALSIALDGLGIQMPLALQNYVFTVAVALPAVAMGIAILRYRLWDIDVLINRTLVYGALTAALAAVYLGDVALFQGLLRSLTGQRSDLAVVAATLLVAVLFYPLRQRLQTVVDRRFYRRKYDAAQTLAAFSARLRDEVDLDAVTADLVAVVDDTVQPTHVALWLREPDRHP
jgi:hypothetical protein